MYHGSTLHSWARLVLHCHMVVHEELTLNFNIYLTIQSHKPLNCLCTPSILTTYKSISTWLRGWLIPLGHGCVRCVTRHLLDFLKGVWARDYILQLNCMTKHQLILWSLHQAWMEQALYSCWCLSWLLWMLSVVVSPNVTGSCWNLLPGEQHRTATRLQSCSSWDLLFISVPPSQCSDRQYKSVMKSLTGLPSCLRLLSPTLLKINILMLHKVSLKLVRYHFPFPKVGKEIGRRPFCFFVVYSSRLCRVSPLSDGIRPTLWDGLPPCNSSVLTWIGRIAKDHEQSLRRHELVCMTSSNCTHAHA